MIQSNKESRIAQWGCRRMHNVILVSSFILATAEQGFFPVIRQGAQRTSGCAADSLSGKIPPEIFRAFGAIPIPRFSFRDIGIKRYSCYRDTASTHAFLRRQGIYPCAATRGAKCAEIKLSAFPEVALALSKTLLLELCQIIPQHDRQTALFASRFFPA